MFDFREKYNLTQISKNELWDLRVKMIPMIIVKYGNNLYYTEKVKLFNQMLFDIKRKYVHKCNICKNMSGFSTDMGGCNKTHDIFMVFPYNRNIKSLKDLKKNNDKDDFDPYIAESSDLDKALENLKDSCRIEKYPEITFGVELLTRSCQRCLILNCTRFDMYDSLK